MKGAIISSLPRLDLSFCPDCQHSPVNKKTEVVYPYLDNLIGNLSNYEFDQYTKVNQTTVENDIDSFCVEHFEKEKWTILSCRIYPVLFQYIILSTYSWMCCEGKCAP